ncbi:MAG: protein kinase [Thermoanaerobaculales bacterium]|nr:protein kinase [Thermoanaerobaculales bacterium]
MATALEPLEGKYEILEKIREGGMGAVYKVRHRLLDELRVVKVMRPQLAEDEVLRARFLREAKVAIRLHHPNLAQIYDFTVDDKGYAYLVMEFIDGLNLQDVMKVLGRSAIGLMLEVACQSLDAIAYLHRKRIIHRDISPDNLLVTRDDERRLQVKLIDLGIAKDREVEDSLTSAGTFLGKVRYSSPEHFRTHEGAQVGVRSDLYSFGVVLYEMLTGTYPIRGSSVASLISGHLMHPPIGFDASDPDGALSETLRAIVLKALAKQPEDRFDSATSFHAALAPHRAEHPLEAEQLQSLFDLPTLTTRRIKTVKPGSTQSRMDRNFGLSTTPAPGAEDHGDDALETSGTIETGSQGRGRGPEAEQAVQSQIRALLVGAGKLIEGKHFDEARLQLATVLELAPGNEEAKKLQKAIEAADLKMQQRRQRAADGIRQALLGGQLERAEALLADALKGMGPAELFDRIGDELTEARTRSEARTARLAEIDARATEALAQERCAEAVDLLREAHSLEPADRALKARLAAAEASLAAQLEARRRAKEIADTAARIAAQIDEGAPDEAERALTMAVKVYGAQKAFDELRARVDALRERLRRDEAQALRDRARGLIEAGGFGEAIGLLEQARRLAPGLAAGDELLAAAREGQRLTEEARRRTLEIDQTKLRVERLIHAGRLESAGLVVDAAVGELGDFEDAAGLRARIAEVTGRRDAAAAQLRLLLDRALELSGQDRFADAEDALEQARTLALEFDELADEVRDTDVELRRRIDAHRRQVAIDKVVQSIERQLGKAAVDEARRELAVAQRLYGSSDALDELSARIDTRARELRREEVDRLLDAALAGERAIAEVVADLEAATAVDPHDERVQRVLVSSRAAQRRLADAEVEGAAAADLAEVDRLIADGHPAEALQVLARAVARCGDFASARVLQRRLAAR